MRLTRRAVLQLLAAVGLMPTSALAFGPPSRMGCGELDLGPGTLSRASAWKNLLAQVRRVSAVETRSTVTPLTLRDPALFTHPFCVLLGAQSFEQPAPAELAQLARYLAYGGFLVCDDTSGERTSPFYLAVERLVSALFPTRPLAPLPTDHAIYRSFFLLNPNQANDYAPWLGQPVGRVARHAGLAGVTVGPFTPLVVCRNDLSGALDQSPLGEPTYPCVPGGENQRREAVKLGVNLALYALTSNYKRDQVHQAELLRRGQVVR